MTLFSRRQNQTFDNIKIVAEPGASLEKISPLIQRAKQEVKNIKNVVLALGTNDVSNTSSSGATSALFLKAITKVEQAIPGANVFTSGITLKKDNQPGVPNTKVKVCNEKIKEINDFLKETVKTSENQWFIGNSNTLKATATNIYKKSDNTHLNAMGVATLLRLISDGVEKAKTSSKKAAGKKRPRSQGTPPSSKKDSKLRREETEDGQNYY